jgi:hypothetical protein
MRARISDASEDEVRRKNTDLLGRYKLRACTDFAMQRNLQLAVHSQAGDIYSRSTMQGHRGTALEGRDRVLPEHAIGL